MDLCWALSGTRAPASPSPCPSPTYQTQWPRPRVWSVRSTERRPRFPPRPRRAWGAEPRGAPRVPSALSGSHPVTGHLVAVTAVVVLPRGAPSPGWASGCPRPGRRRGQMATALFIIKNTNVSISRANRGKRKMSFYCTFSPWKTSVRCSVSLGTSLRLVPTPRLPGNEGCQRRLSPKELRVDALCTQARTPPTLT